MTCMLTFELLIYGGSTTYAAYANGPCLLDYLILKLRLPVVLYVSFAVVSR